jgi:hypothetical protein
MVVVECMVIHSDVPLYKVRLDVISYKRAKFSPVASIVLIEFMRLNSMALPLPESFVYSVPASDTLTRYLAVTSRVRARTCRHCEDNLPNVRTFDGKGLSCLFDGSQRGEVNRTEAKATDAAAKGPGYWT